MTEGNDKTGPTITLPGQVQGNLVKKVADFHEDIEGSPFAKDLATKSQPGGERKLNPKRNPPESYGFQMTLNFKPASQWAKNKAAAPTNTKPAK